MSKKLPVLVRLGIRDLFEDPTSDLNKALKSLNDLLGAKLTLEIPWQDVVRDLSKHFADDMKLLTLCVAEAITMFLRRLEGRLDGDESFQDTFLEKFRSLAQQILVVIHDEPKPRSAIINHRITLFIPTTSATGFRQQDALYGADLGELLADNLNESAGTNSKVGSANEPDWDTVDVVPDLKATKSKSVKATSATSRAHSTFDDTQGTSAETPRPLPKLNALSRPEVLFPTLLPALVMVHGGSTELYVEGTHPPTLELIADYFTNHARKDLQGGGNPCFRVEKIACSIGSGTMYDCVKLERWNHHRHWDLNVSLVLSFIQSVCGYEIVDNAGPRANYMFRRTTPFA